MNFRCGAQEESLLYTINPRLAKKTEGFGGSFGLGYTRFFWYNWGFLVGVEGTLYNAKISIDRLQDAYDTKDRHNGDSITYMTRFDKYTEKQQLINLNIPIMVQFQAGKKHQFYASGGFKLGLPISAKYESSDNEFSASGYHFNTEQTFYHQRDWNYGEFVGQGVNGKYDIDLLYIASLELGVKWILKNPQYALYTGIYADYTCNNVNTENTNKFLDYSATKAEMDQFAQNSVLTSQYTNKGTTQSFVNKMQPVAAGVKVRLSMNTCGGEDTDSDGVVDNKDLCPNTPFGAPVDKNGCPLDSDKDGVYDFIDKCPNTPEGVQVNSEGCPPDSDGDGVPDYLDKCPGTLREARGFVDEHGCPKDSDGDGVLDYKDECPNTRQGAPVDEKGCPKDSDGDGVADYADECPGTPSEARGFVDERGCPQDSDGDGVVDYLDRCPGTPRGATVNKYGCPKDTDGDGVFDYADKCPGTPKEAHGFVDEHGCPKDSDNDGVPDYKDKCPTTPGVPENYGCPEIKDEEKQVFERALRGINFETGKDIIRPESYAILNEIVRVLAEKPHYNLEIYGHTDNVGKPASNQILSERRAASVKNYLVGYGISEGRIISAGFGDTRPVAPNNSVANKALNRRVEFVVKFEE